MVLESSLTISIYGSLEQEKVESAVPSPVSDSMEVEVTEPETKDSETTEAKKARLKEEQRQKRKAVSVTLEVYRQPNPSPVLCAWCALIRIFISTDAGANQYDGSNGRDEPV